MAHEKPVLSLGDFLFPRIFQAFRLALQPSKLALAFVAVTTICLTGWLLDRHPTVVRAANYRFGPALRASAGLPATSDATELEVYLVEGPDVLSNFLESRQALEDRTGVFAALRRVGTAEFHRAVYSLLSVNLPEAARSVRDGGKAVFWAIRWHPGYSLVFFTVAAAVLSVAGGAICRLAALQLAHNEKPSLVPAVRFARCRILSLLGGPLGSLALVLILGAPIVLMGLIGNLPYVGEVLTALLLALALVGACAATVTLIGGAGGVGLMVPAVAYENADGFDAIGHTFSYVYTQPARLAFYTLVATVSGALGYLFVRLFVFLVLWLTYHFLAIGFLGQNAKLETIWPEPTFASLLGPAGPLPQTWSLWLAALLVRLWVLVLVGLLASFVVSFYFSANAIIYALMRWCVHGTPLEEVYLDPTEASTDSPSVAASPTVAMSGSSPPGSRTPT